MLGCREGLSEQVFGLQQVAIRERERAEARQGD
jgi:hypothetical protein